MNPVYQLLVDTASVDTLITICVEVIFITTATPSP
jgi:hypothetical protein